MGARLATAPRMASGNRACGFWRSGFRRKPGRSRQRHGPPCVHPRPKPRALALGVLPRGCDRGLARSRQRHVTPADARSAPARRWPCAPRPLGPSGAGWRGPRPSAPASSIVSKRCSMRAFSQSRSASSTRGTTRSSGRSGGAVSDLPVRQSAPGAAQHLPRTAHPNGVLRVDLRGGGRIVLPQGAEQLPGRQDRGLGTDFVGDGRNFGQPFGERPEIEAGAAHDDWAQLSLKERRHRPQPVAHRILSLEGHVAIERVGHACLLLGGGARGQDAPALVRPGARRH